MLAQVALWTASPETLLLTRRLQAESIFRAGKFSKTKQAHLSPLLYWDLFTCDEKLGTVRFPSRWSCRARLKEVVPGRQDLGTKCKKVPSGRSAQGPTLIKWLLRESRSTQSCSSKWSQRKRLCVRFQVIFTVFIVLFCVTLIAVIFVLRDNSKGSFCGKERYSETDPGRKVGGTAGWHMASISAPGRHCGFLLEIWRICKRKVNSNHHRRPLLHVIFLITAKVNLRLADFSRIWRANIVKERKTHTKETQK